MARTKYSPPTYDLDPQQLQALDLLLSGKTVTETAAAVGVDRTTVSRWKLKDAGFQAAYNAALLSAWEAGHKKRLDAWTKAIDTLTGLLDEEDPQVVLKAAAALVRLEPVRPSGYTDPEKLTLYNF